MFGDDVKTLQFSVECQMISNEMVCLDHCLGVFDIEGHEAVFGVFYVTHKQYEIIWSELMRAASSHLCGELY